MPLANSDKSGSVEAVEKFRASERSQRRNVRRDGKERSPSFISILPLQVGKQASSRRRSGCEFVVTCAALALGVLEALAAPTGKGWGTFCSPHPARCHPFRNVRLLGKRGRKPVGRKVGLSVLRKGRCPLGQMGLVAQPVRLCTVVTCKHPSSSSPPPVFELSLSSVLL